MSGIFMIERWSCIIEAIFCYMLQNNQTLSSWANSWGYPPCWAAARNPARVQSVLLKAVSKEECEQLPATNQSSLILLIIP